MRHEDQEEIEERLVDWELARLQGQSSGEPRPPDEPRLPDELAQWESYWQQRLEVLRKTAWMLDDPAAGTSPQTSASQPSAPPPGASPPGASGTAAPPMPEVPGFEEVGLLGRGGFGVVYRALDKNLQRQVAIKFPLIAGSRERQKYIAEARNASRVDVPGIVPIYHVGQTGDGTPYVIQKLIEGPSLHDILQQGGCLSASQTVELFLQLCYAVAAAHARSLVHRDLKPENVLIDHDGFPWITDFGLSLAEDDPHLPLAGVGGTPHFMAPEQIQGRVEWLDGRCDLWALGVMLYQCLTGRLPFHSSDRLELQDKILNFQPRPIAQRQPLLPGDWDHIFNKCCAKSVGDRYHAARELAEDLQRLGRGLDAKQQQHNPVLLALQTDRSPGATGRRKYSLRSPIVGWTSWTFRPATNLAVAALALVLVVGVVVLLRRWPQPGELVVALDGSGTHGSIAAALAAGLAGGKQACSILIEPGVYRESLVISGNVTLRARSKDQLTQIIGSHAPALSVVAGGQLAMQHLHISVDASTAGVWNAIDVRGGSLLLDDCQVVADQYDCVRLQSEAELVATQCEFHTRQHPAIFAELAGKLIVRQCRFTMGDDNVAAGPYLAGMQIIQTGGSVSGCTFHGAAVGIEWSQTSELVSIDDCKFENMQRALIATACGELRLGRLGRSEFENCATAIELTGCGGAVQNCDIDARGRSEARGILIRGRPLVPAPLSLQTCSIQGARTPLVLSQTDVDASNVRIQQSSDVGLRVLDNSKLRLDSSQIRNCEVAGLSLEGSVVELQRCTVAGNQVVGVTVDGLDDALLAKSCVIDDNPVGILVLSGGVQLEHSQVQRANTGILMARRHLLTFAATCDAQLTLIADGGAVSGRQSAIEFLSPGSYRLSDCQTNDPGNQPVIDSALERSVRGETTAVRLRAAATPADNL